LIKRQLNLLGYAAETAEDGREALQAWRSGRFGLVITDCHMPEMDGYEMTRLIREAEAGNGGHRTPILACTANVLEGEAEACLQAGMDGYLPKPVELQVLIGALDRWLPLPEAARPEPPAELPATGATANGADDGPIYITKLAEISAGDKAFERELLADFRNAADDDAKQLGAALESGDCDQITRVAHRLKGASRTVGAMVLATLSERMEMAARSSDRPAIGAIKDPLFQEVERLRSHLANL
jgi:CheY-like chemotaxis protein/HPt (histidine-containing phosphotransfer) domain-containing protein